MLRYPSVAVPYVILLAGAVAFADDFPPVSELPVQSELPDPLTMLDGSRVTTKELWEQKRRPELKALFQHYMYGYLPAAAPVKASVVALKSGVLDGKASLKVVTLHYGPEGTPPISLLVVTPKHGKGRPPVFIGINFCGNHTVLADPVVPLTTSWYRDRCPGCEDSIATEEGRGGQVDVWNVEKIIDRGYALATFYYGDVDPDKSTNDFTDGVQPHFFKPGQTEPGRHDWGAVAAWAYGVHRVIDYLETDGSVDTKRLALVGHSRLGKATLFAGALDERIRVVIPHQAGCGGTAPNRFNVGESVERINTSFPHWFNDTFPEFNKEVERLPFDQHCLVALCAPRAVLFSNAQEDQWADPNGQFNMLTAADPVYRFLGVDGLPDGAKPETGKLMNSRLGYFIREGKHSMTTEDWDVFLEFADRHLR
ncbi:MAG: acetylxylan esterase [Planctomycetota bacterium]|nr:acetylxylan esterase [Planctomycetota bacterium]